MGIQAAGTQVRTDETTAGSRRAAVAAAGEQPADDKAAQPQRMTVGRAILMGLGWVSLAVGVVGIFVPLLPTTEFVMLAAFLFMKSSPRFHTWLLGTKVYRTYVQPFKETGGIPKKTKIRMLAISLTVLAVSAVVVPRWYVWLVLGVVAAALLYLLLVRIPTRDDDAASACPQVAAAAEED